MRNRFSAKSGELESDVAGSEDGEEYVLGVRLCSLSGRDVRTEGKGRERGKRIE